MTVTVAMTGGSHKRIFRLWFPWPSRGWPALPEEEARWSKSWGSPHLESRRSHATAVLGVLRSGVSFDEVSRVVPGLTRPMLAEGYAALSEPLAVALSSARTVIGATLDQEVSNAQVRHLLELQADEMHKILPVPTERLMVFNKSGVSSQAIRDQLRLIISDVKATHARMDRLYAQVRLASRCGLVDDACKAGEHMFSTFDESLITSSMFLPRRVGELDPHRSRLLLDPSLITGRAVS